MLTGGDLDPYKVLPPTNCWWCGSPGPLTREHKFKRSDLDRMWDPADGLVWGDDSSLREVRSARKSAEVRFLPVLCGPCNNQRSQPFDEAYQIFSDFVWHRPDLIHARYIDMSDVYGNDWPVKVPDFARYLAKHIGCRMAHEQFPVPPSLKAFLDGAKAAPDVHMVLFKSRDHYRFYHRGVRDGFDTRGLWISSAQGAVSRSRQKLTMYSSGLVISFIGLMYRWEEGCPSTDPFYDYQRARLHWRHRLPSV